MGVWVCAMCAMCVSGKRSGSGCGVSSGCVWCARVGARVLPGGVQEKQEPHT